MFLINWTCTLFLQTLSLNQSRSTRFVTIRWKGARFQATSTLSHVAVLYSILCFYFFAFFPNFVARSKQKCASIYHCGSRRRIKRRRLRRVFHNASCGRSIGYFMILHVCNFWVKISNPFTISFRKQAAATGATGTLSHVAVLCSILWFWFLYAFCKLRRSI